MLPCRSHASLMHSRGLLIPICLPWLPGKNIFPRVHSLIPICLHLDQSLSPPSRPNGAPSRIRNLAGLTNGLEYTYSSPSAYTSTLGFEIDQNPCFHFWSAMQRFVAAVTLKASLTKNHVLPENHTNLEIPHPLQYAAWRIIYHHHGRNLRFLHGKRTQLDVTG
ncbi:hypothetical protein ONZ45_g16509 [Pleurotus djamor]|nr:hypothetical protein ONZ45_g16509 [Pleurotus djamor]